MLTFELVKPPNSERLSILFERRMWIWGQGVGGYAGNRVTIDVLPRGPLTLLIIRSITIKQGIHTDGPENWADSQW